MRERGRRGRRREAEREERGEGMRRRRGRDIGVRQNMMEDEGCEKAKGCRDGIDKVRN